MLETEQASYHSYEGCDPKSSPTNLPENVYTLVRNIIPIKRIATRVPGKTLHSSYTDPAIGMCQMGDDKFVAQIGTEMHIVDL